MRNLKKNHLKSEKSPYLLQHIYNPVDWYPWSSDTFALAKKQNKPVFLSIGYSTCHWCHVMAHESFEDKQVAEILNRFFICVKVDREERPDIDKIYMNFCQLLTGSGGWPLTIIMTPDKKPFFAATYIPKQSRYGMKGLIDILTQITTMWQNNAEQLLQSAGEITKVLQKHSQSFQNSELSVSTLDAAYTQLLHSYDKQNGGFGLKPKFPTPHTLLFLLKYWNRTHDRYCLNMVETTLERMRMGGMYDHIGFGFHRYSTDNKWILPHFEKMLYDQALLLMAYTEAYQATKKQLYKQTAEQIITYVCRDLRSENGGFYSAEDADSEGAEGKFYVWEYDELQNILTKQELEFSEKFYAITKEGNFKSEVGEKNNTNIFYQTMSINEFSVKYSISEKQILLNIENIRQKLYQTRTTRIHPQKDDKILTDWNALMITALAKAAVVFDNDAYIELAEKAMDFLLKHMINKDSEILHRYRDGDAGIVGYADDYAFSIWALIELYQATFNSKYLKLSLDLNQYLLDHFWDEEYGGIFFTSDKNEQLIAVSKELYDGAIPSANSVTFHNLLRLASITGNTNLQNKAAELSKTFSSQINKTPASFSHMINGLYFLFGPSYQIVIVGNKKSHDTKNIVSYLHLLYLPSSVIILKEIQPHDILLETLIPFIKDYSQLDSKATIYLCKNNKCHLPSADITTIKEFFD